MMDKRNITKQTTLQILLVVCMYLFVAVSHIFYLPCLTNQQGAKAPVSNNSLFKRKTEQLNNANGYISYLQRTDKSITNDKRSVTEFLKNVTVCFVLLLFVAQLWKLLPRRVFNARRPDAGLQPVYLTIRSLRI